MPDQSIANHVEKAAELLVLAEPSDLTLLADLHTHLQAIVEWAKGESKSKLAEAVEAASNQVEEIILQEAEEPAAALESISVCVSGAQQIIIEGRDESEVSLSASPVGKSSELPEPGVFEYELSPMVDEKILGDFLGRQPGVLDEMEEQILSLEHGDESTLLPALRRLVHTLKGEAGLIGISQVERLCHIVEDAIDQGEASGLGDILLDVKDWLSRVFDWMAGRGEEQPESSQTLIQRLEEPGTAESQPVPTPEPVEEAASPADEAPAPSEASPEPAEPRFLTGDPSLLSEFVTEAQEHLDNCDVHLLTVETDPRDEEALNAVFRAFHTIKGVAGFLDLGDIQSLAHDAENLLDKARKGERKLSGANMDLTFEAVDLMKRLVGHVAQSLSTAEALPVEPALPGLVERLNQAVTGEIAEEVSPVQSAADEEIEDSAAGKQRLGDILVESGAITRVDLEDTLRQHGGAKHEQLGELLVQKSCIARSQLKDALRIQSEDGRKRPLGEILIEMGAVTQADIDRALDVQAAPPAPKMGEVLVREQKVPAKEVAQALRTQNQQQRVEVREALRVDADRLDRLIDLVGELVIAESMVSQSPEIAQHASPVLSRQLGQLDKITRELQEIGMSLRMVPCRATFQKMARLVRDLAKKSGKQVEFEMAGEDTELDKSVVDKIGDPLVHMVRNAVDHGLEASAEDRVAAGKTPAGHVTLRAYHKGGSIHIEIQDDGRGLDREVIIAKAIERGLIKEEDNLSDREVWNLIFEPGFSTAKKITDVSGRGVGMDVVKRNIEALRGQVEIHSEKGKGSTFIIRLPLTLAIIDGMVVRVGEERYIIPTLTVVRSVKPESQEMFSVVKKGEMLSLQGQLLPLFRLGRLFSISDAVHDATEALVVIVEDDGKQAGIVIDELLGQQQIVIKSLGESMKGIPGISGGAIMSDGRVGLIIDVGGLIKLANNTNGNAGVNGSMGVVAGKAGSKETMNAGVESAGG